MFHFQDVLSCTTWCFKLRWVHYLYFQRELSDYLVRDQINRIRRLASAANSSPAIRLEGHLTFKYFPVDLRVFKERIRMCSIQNDIECLFFYIMIPISYVYWYLKKKTMKSVLIYGRTMLQCFQLCIIFSTQSRSFVGTNSGGSGGS